MAASVGGSISSPSGRAFRVTSGLATACRPYGIPLSTSSPLSTSEFKQASTCKFGRVARCYASYRFIYSSRLSDSDFTDGLRKRAPINTSDTVKPDSSRLRRVHSTARESDVPVPRPRHACMCALHNVPSAPHRFHICQEQLRPPSAERARPIPTRHRRSTHARDDRHAVSAGRGAWRAAHGLRRRGGRATVATGRGRGGHRG